MVVSFAGVEGQAIVGSGDVRRVLTRYYKGPCGHVPWAREFAGESPVTFKTGAPRRTNGTAYT